MKATPTISAALAVLLPLLASCASPGTNGGPASASKVVPPREVSLTNAAGNLRLHAPAEFIGPMRLQAYGDTLLEGALPRSATAAPPWLRVGDESFPTLDAAQPVPAATLQSNDWQYLRIDGATAASGVLKSARRHMLLIDPDLVVVLDELVLTHSTSIEIQLPSLKPFQHDTVRDEWTLNSEHSGLVARFLSLPKAVQSWNATAASGSSRGTTNSAAGWMRSVVTESGPEFHHLAIFAVHTNQARGSLSFKLLESDTAIGARIHRDGLPTLVAFRKVSCAGEANLTGLKFTAPVAVDVFRPKRRK